MDILAALGVCICRQALDLHAILFPLQTGKQSLECMCAPYAMALHAFYLVHLCVCLHNIVDHTLSIVTVKEVWQVCADHAQYVENRVVCTGTKI